MDDWNKEDCEDQDRRNKTESRCGKHNLENERSETDITRLRERDEDVDMRRWNLKMCFISLAGDPWWPCWWP